MIEGLKPYAEYKESGHRWLGSVPNHWPVLPNRALFDEIKDRNHPKEEMLSVTITRGIVRQKALLDGSSKKDSSNLNKGAYKLVQPHDIAYNKMRAWQGALGASTLRGIISPAYVVMRPRKEANPVFYHNLYRTPSFAKEAERWSYGITSDMWSLRPEHFKVIGSVLPPPDEQAAIVRFLDHANRKIDGFIRAKRKLIGLLNEQKQAIIHRAVTGKDEVRMVKDENGNSSFILQPSTLPKKPSGIPWLGDIPKHWEVRRLSSVTKFISTKAHEQFVDAAGTHICVTARFVSTGGVARKFCTRNLSPAAKGDVLMVMSDLPNGRALARAFLVEDEASYAVNQQVCIIRPSKMIPAFLAHQANRSWGLLQHDDHCNQTHLSNRDFKTLPLLCPPISEQEEILRAIDAQTKHIPSLIARTEREIALMQEYRTRLTADLVTGNLDVREAAAKLPDLPTDTPDEPLEENEPEEAEL